MNTEIIKLPFNIYRIIMISNIQGNVISIIQKLGVGTPEETQKLGTKRGLWEIFELAAQRTSKE